MEKGDKIYFLAETKKYVRNTGFRYLSNKVEKISNTLTKAT